MTRRIAQVFTVLLILLGSCGAPSAPAPAPSPSSDAGIADALPRPRTGFGNLSPQGGTITSVLPTTGGGLTGGGSAGAVMIGLLTTCSSTQVLQWNGSAWACGTGGITNSAGNNVIPKSNGTNLVASSLSDNGTTVSTAEAVSFTTTLGVTGISTLAGGISQTGTVNNPENTFAGISWFTHTGTSPDFYVAGKAEFGSSATFDNHVANHVANGIASDDVAAFGQIASGVNTAVAGTTNTIAMFTGTNAVGNSIIVQSGSVETVGGSGAAGLDVGGDTTASTNLQDGWRVTANVDGNVYVDHKSVTSGTINYRFGGGANPGSAATWMQVATSGGLTTFPLAVTIAGQGTVQNVNGFYVQDSGTPTASVRLVSAAGVNFLESGTSQSASAAPLTIASMNGGTTYATWDASGNFTAPHTATVNGLATFNASGAVQALATNSGNDTSIEIKNTSTGGRDFLLDSGGNASSAPNVLSIFDQTGGTFRAKFGATTLTLNNLSTDTLTLHGATTHDGLVTASAGITSTVAANTFDTTTISSGNLTVTSGNLAVTAGTVTAGSNVTTGGSFIFTGGTGFAFGLNAASSGNQTFNISAAGTGLIQFNSNAGGLPNAGTGGLSLVGGANTSASVWSVSGAGNQINTGTLAVTGAITGSSTLRATKILSETQEVDYTRGFEFFDEFLTSNDATDNVWNVANANSSLATAPISNHPGLVSLLIQPNGTGLGNATAAFWKGSSTAPGGWSPGGGATAIAWEYTVPAVTAAGTAFGVTDTNTAAPTNGIYCFTQVTTGTNVQGCTTAASVSTCANTSPVVAITAGDWYRCEIAVNAAGTSVTFTITDVTAATSGTLTTTTNIPASSASLGLNAALTRNSTTGSGSSKVDFAYMHQTFTTAR